MLNGDAIGEISQCRKLSGGNIKAGWETISSYYENVTWAQGTNSTVLAAIIATVLGFCGPAAVIACVGMITLGALANACINCTLQIDLQQFVIDISYIQYRYIWSIIVSATESYGPYIYTV